MMSKNRRALAGSALALCAVGLVVLATSSAAAQTSTLQASGPPGGIDDVLMVARDSTPRWIETLMPYAWRVFFTGAVCELIYKLGKAKLSGELTTIVETLVYFVLRKGFWIFVLSNVQSIAPGIVVSLQQAGATASHELGGGITPQRIMNGLQQLARVQTEGLSSWNILRSVEVLVALLLVCVSFGLCAVFAWIAWFRAYIVLGAGSIMLGFAGTIWTEDYAKRYLQYAVGAGLHLLVIELLKGLFFGYLDQWTVWAIQDEHWGLQTALKMVLSALAILVALISVPGFVAGIAHGNLSFAADAAATAATAKAVSSVASLAAALPSKLDALMGKAVDAFKGAMASSGGGGSGGASAGGGAASPLGVEIVDHPSSGALAAFDSSGSPRLGDGGGESSGPGSNGHGGGPQGGGGGSGRGGPRPGDSPRFRPPELLLGSGDRSLSEQLGSEENGHA